MVIKENYKSSAFLLNTILAVIVIATLIIRYEDFSKVELLLYSLSIFIMLISAFIVLKLKDDKRRFEFETEIYSTLLSGIIVSLIVETIVSGKLSEKLIILLLGLIIVYSVIMYKKYAYKD